MLSLLSLFTGNWKKNGAVLYRNLPRRWLPHWSRLPFLLLLALHRPPLWSGNGCFPTTSGWWHAGWQMGLCVYGTRGGLGKTRVVLQTLEAEGVEPVILTGHCTPLAMYLALYEHPDSIVFLDDCDAMFRNLPALGILRSACGKGTRGTGS